MNRIASPCAQRGATLVVGLIMLVLITLVVSTAFTLSNTNLKAVGNMQFRDEAIAAANLAIEQKLSSAFTNPPTAEPINVDVDNDGITDYVVNIALPQCVRASTDSSSPPSSVFLSSALSAGSTWNTVWDIDATVTSSQNTGVAIHVHQGVRVLLSDSDKIAVCS
jgi:Tfp pilus assembly protein PilX